MSERVTLESGDLRSRLRTQPVNHRSSSYQSRTPNTHAVRPVVRRQTVVTDFVAAPRKKDDEQLPEWLYAPQEEQPEETTVAEEPEPAIVEAKPVVGHVPQPTQVLARAAVRRPVRRRKRVYFGRISQAQALMAMAVCVFVVGMSVSIMGFYANRVASAQAVFASKQVDAHSAVASTNKPPDDAPSTSAVSSAALKAYVVAPDLARYLNIPKINVHARVLQVGVTKDGALGTPANVFDTAWYTGSAKPGQPGATLIDGHVSSWTTNGVFYDLKKLAAGDSIFIEKGDGSVLTYSVQKVVAYDASNVDMQAMMQPAVAGKSGLNLMTCGGKYDSKSKEFTQRIAVFAVLE